MIPCLKSRRPLFSVIFVFFLVGCSTTKKIATLKPEPDTNEPAIYESSHSFINIPVSIKLKEIERLTNESLKGLIYEDKNYDDDNLTMQVWKQAPVQITYDKGKIKTVLPLKALAKYRITTRNFGNFFDNIREINLNGSVTFTSDVALINWKLKTATTLRALKWNEAPTISVLGQDVPVTNVVNPAVALFKSAIEQSIDLAIAESMDFKPQVLDALEKICTPFEMSETYESWLRVVPVELYTTDAILEEKSIRFRMGMKCTMETLVGTKPESGFNRNTIVLKPVQEIPENVTANIVAISTYKDASRIMTRNFKGYEFGEGKKKVSVKNVDIWQKDNKMILALDLEGSIAGTIYLTGYPQYNDVTKEVYFDKLDYVLDTKNALLKSAGWLAGNYVLLQLQERCRYSIESNMEEGKQNIMKYLDKYSPVSGVYVNGNVEDIRFQRIQLTSKAIIAFIKLNGTMEVKVGDAD